MEEKKEYKYPVSYAVHYTQKDTPIYFKNTFLILPNPIEEEHILSLECRIEREEFDINYTGMRVTVLAISPLGVLQ